MKLYHYTSAEHLPLILEAGYLKTTESNVSFKREHAGPDVVWLTTRDEANSSSHGLANPRHDKTEWRFTVEVDKRNAHKWSEWVKRQGSSADTIQTLIDTAGGGHRTWYVTAKELPADCWLEIRNMKTGEVLPFRKRGAHTLHTQADISA